MALSCLADGSKLPLLVIFKRKILPKSVKFSDGVNVRVHIKGWMDGSVVKDWLETVGNRSHGILMHQKNK